MCDVLLYRATDRPLYPYVMCYCTGPLPVSLRVEVLSPDLAALSWVGGEGSQQDRYQVRYKGEMVSTQWSSVQLVNDGTETNMTDLTPGDRYLFEVTAFSVDQRSDPATETGTMCKWRK